MSETHTVQATQQAELQRRLWSIANDLRGNMDASEFRNYILGLIFYRFLSDGVSGKAGNGPASQHCPESISFQRAYGSVPGRDTGADSLRPGVGQPDGRPFPVFSFLVLLENHYPGR